STAIDVQHEWAEREFRSAHLLRRVSPFGVIRPRRPRSFSLLLRVLATPANQTAAQTKQSCGNERAACRLGDGCRLTGRVLYAAADLPGTVDPQRTAAQVVRVLDMNSGCWTRRRRLVARERDRQGAYGRESIVDAARGRAEISTEVPGVAVAAEI